MITAVTLPVVARRHRLTLLLRGVVAAGTAVEEAAPALAARELMAGAEEVTKSKKNHLP